MTSVQIKGVPEQTHAVLRERAARAHQSLQEYLLGLLVREASAPTLDEVFDRVAQRSGGQLSFSQAAQDLRDDRDSR
jgi:plasmid stability protein